MLSDIRLTSWSSARLVLWIAASLCASEIIAPNFLALLNQTLTSTFGDVFPAIPFAALLLVLFLLRGKDLYEILDKEGSLRAEAPTRIAGLAVILILAFLVRPFSYGSVYAEGVEIVAVFYAVSLVLNPLTRVFMAPYAALYIIGISAPAIITWALGEPLATFSAILSARFTSLSGIPITWQGTTFALESRTGEYLSATVTPGCSSVISITTFLGLLGLMHLDLKKKASSTLKIALIGVLALTLLNSLRILILVLAGYLGGPAELWSLHNWVGYALFLGFYLVATVAYGRMPARSTNAATVAIL